MTLALTTITHSIAGLTVTGLKRILDLDELLNSVTEGSCPVLYPEPVNTVSDMTVTRMAQLIATTPWNVEYILTYTLLYAPIGSGRGMDLISPTLVLAMKVVDKILASPAAVSGAVTVYFESMTQPGPIADPSGNQFFGCQFGLRILEMMN